MAHKKAVIGSPANFWLHSTKTGFDLTHPPKADSPLLYPRVPLQTTTAQVTIDPAKSALVVVDMQNFFLSPQLGRSKYGKGIKASDQLLKYAIPACRKAGIRIIWLNWGLTQEEIDVMPPATLRAFGFTVVPHDAEVDHKADGETAVDDHGINTGADVLVKNLPPQPAFGKSPRLYKGLGSDIGPVELEDGTMIDGGRLLMRDQWNAALYAPLEEARQQGLGSHCKRKDVWIHKNRMSGLWGSETPCTRYLEEQGIKTLLFAGVNTDQCVAGSLTDAFSKGYDCLMLNDGCATTTPDEQGGQACVEYNSAKTWGFSLSCEALAKGVESMQHK